MDKKVDPKSDKVNEQTDTRAVMRNLKDSKDMLTEIL